MKDGDDLTGGKSVDSKKFLGSTINVHAVTGVSSKGLELVELVAGLIDFY